MQQTLKVTAQEVVVFNDNQLGVFDGVDNIGLEIQVDQLVSVEPVSSKEIELHVHVPLGYEVPDLIDETKWDIY
jgi:hypothetical protein